MATADPPTDAKDNSTPKEDTDTQSSPAASAQIQKAEALFIEAEKKVASASSFIGKIFGGASKLEDAADMYTRAANQFKLGKAYERSGDSYVEAAKLHSEKLDSRHEAANDYAEAAQVYKRAVPEPFECYQQAIDIYSDMGRFSLAARYYMNMGEIEEEQSILDKAITYYEQSADFFRGEDSNASANKCLLKVAHLSAQLQQFKKAADLFEEIGKSCLDSGLLKYSAKDHFFKALVCWFCYDKEQVETKKDEYKAIHPAFDGTRELKLIENLLEAVNDEDTDKFSEHVQEYDNISRIDPWLTAQLLHVKSSMDESPNIN